MTVSFSPAQPLFSGIAKVMLENSGSTARTLTPEACPTSPEAAKHWENNKDPILESFLTDLKRLKTLETGEDVSMGYTTAAGFPKLSDSAGSFIMSDDDYFLYSQYEAKGRYDLAENMRKKATLIEGKISVDNSELVGRILTALG